MSSCSDCAAFHADDTSRATGECRRYAPRPDAGAPSVAGWSWPQVDGEDWCLEHCVVDTVETVQPTADLEKRRDDLLSWLELTAELQPAEQAQQHVLARLRLEAIEAVTQIEEELA